MAQLSDILKDLSQEEADKLKRCVAWLIYGNSIWDLALQVIDPGARGLEALDECWNEIETSIKDAAKNQDEQSEGDYIQNELDQLRSTGETYFVGSNITIE